MTHSISSKKNKSINLFWDIIIRNKNWLVVYTIIMFLATSLPVWLLSYNRSINLGNMHVSDSYTYNHYFSEYYIGFVIVGFIAAIALATVVTRFMHQRNSIDLYYALPIKRGALFMSHYLAGAALLIAPFIFNGIVIMIIQFAYGFMTQFVGVFLYQMLAMCLMTLVTYTLAIFVAVQLGTSFDTFTMSIVSHFALPFIVLLLILMYTSDLFGFVMPSWLDMALTLIFPTGAMAKIFMGIHRYANYTASTGEFDVLGVVTLLCWVAVAVGLLFLSRWIFTKRKSELSGFTRENSVLVVALKLIITFAGGFAMMFLLYGSLGDSIIIRIIGFVIGSAITFLIVDAIAARGFKNIKKSLPQYISLAMLGTVLIIINKTGGLGYENRVPKPEDVASVVTRRYEVPDGELSSFYYYLINDDDNYGNSYEITDPQAISSMVELHQEIVDHKKDIDRYDDYSRWISIDYTLNNGSNISRSYRNVPYDLYQLRNKLITPEYIKKYHPVYSLNNDNIVSMTLSGMDKNMSVKLDFRMYDELIKAMQQDISDAYADTGAKQGNELIDLYKIDIEATYTVATESGSRKEIVSDYMNIKPYFKNTLEVIKKCMTDGDITLIKADNVGYIYKLKEEYADILHETDFFGYYKYSISNLHSAIKSYESESNDEEYVYATNEEYVAQYFDKIEDESDIEKIVDDVNKFYTGPNLSADEKIDVYYIIGDYGSEYYEQYGYYSELFEIEATIVPRK